jgi:pyrimidine operon attenuation protein/uracil phosphoribosyltransferase
VSTEDRIIMSALDIDLAVERLALHILERNHGDSTLAIVGIFTCGVYVARRIHQHLEKKLGPVPFGSLDINLYRDDWSLGSQNPIVKTTDIPFEVDNSDLILVDDVIFTGRTIRAAMDAIMDFGRPSTIQLAALIDRGRRELPIQPDYVGMVTSVQANERIKVHLDEGGTDGKVVIEKH